MKNPWFRKLQDGDKPILRRKIPIIIDIDWWVINGKKRKYKVLS